MRCSGMKVTFTVFTCILQAVHPYTWIATRNFGFLLYWSDKVLR